MDEKFFDMSYLRIELGDYVVHEYFDKVNTISPILIKKDGRKLNIRGCLQRDSTLRLGIQNEQKRKSSMLVMCSILVLW